MKLEQQVCALKYAKRLKKLNVKQKSLIYWLNIEHCLHMKVKEDGYTLQEDENGNFIIDKIDYKIELGNPFVRNIDEENRWSAFTVAELGELLPPNCYTQKGYENLSNKWICHRIIDNYHTDIWISVREADARAKMLIHLLENNLISL